MWLFSLHIENMMDTMMKMILDKGAEDVVLNGFKKNTWMIRFSKNNLDITRFHDESWIDIYIGYKKRKLLFTINEIDEEKAKSTIDRMIQTSNYLPPYPGYVSLPSKNYNYIAVPDTYVDNINFKELSERISDAIKLGLELKLTDISGSLLITKIKHIVYTSTGNRGEYKKSSSNLNMRLFKRKVSYTVNTESVDPHKIDFEDLVTSGGLKLKKIGKVRKIEAGKYNVLLSPTVMGNLFNYIGRGLSAYSVLIRNSPFIDKIGKQVFDEKITLSDEPNMPGNPGACSFDMEGVPTQDVNLIENGVLKNYIHNLSTAYKFGTESSGHAGLILPLPHSLILKSDEKSKALEDLLLEIKDGVYITNVWYTRFQNYISGDFSTLQRDAGFLIKDGELVNTVAGGRISENIIKMFNKIIGIANDPIWVKWWDYEIPSLMPHVAFEDVNITTSF